MMFDETRFTTTNTGRPAPTWEQRAGMPRLYWRDDEWHAMEDRNRREDDSQRIADFAEAIETRSTPFSRGTKSGNCIICDKPFANGQPDQITCGGEKCKAEQQRRRVRKSHERRVAKQHTRECPVCEEAFTTTYRNKTQRTCGAPECTSVQETRMEAASAIEAYLASVQKMEIEYPHNCEVCGTPFTAKSPRATTCSERCRQRKARGAAL